MCVSPSRGDVHLLKVSISSLKTNNCGHVFHHHPSSGISGLSLSPTSALLYMSGLEVCQLHFLSSLLGQILIRPTNRKHHGEIRRREEEEKSSSVWLQQCGSCWQQLALACGCRCCPSDAVQCCPDTAQGRGEASLQRHLSAACCWPVSAPCQHIQN